MTKYQQNSRTNHHLLGFTSEEHFKDSEWDAPQLFIAIENQHSEGAHFLLNAYLSASCSIWSGQVNKLCDSTFRSCSLLCQFSLKVGCLSLTTAQQRWLSRSHKWWLSLELQRKCCSFNHHFNHVYPGAVVSAKFSSIRWLFHRVKRTEGRQPSLTSSSKSWTRAYTPFVSLERRDSTGPLWSAANTDAEVVGVPLWIQWWTGQRVILQKDAARPWPTVFLDIPLSKDV